MELKITNLLNKVFPERILRKQVVKKRRITMTAVKPLQSQHVKRYYKLEN